MAACTTALKATTSSGLIEPFGGTLLRGLRNFGSNLCLTHQKLAMVKAAVTEALLHSLYSHVNLLKSSSTAKTYDKSSLIETLHLTGKERSQCRRRSNQRGHCVLRRGINPCSSGENLLSTGKERIKEKCQSRRTKSSSGEDVGLHSQPHQRHSPHQD